MIQFATVTLISLQVDHWRPMHPSALADLSQELWHSVNVDLTVFEPLWRKYDVLEDGKVDIDRMPVFLRQICGSAEGCIGLQ